MAKNTTRKNARKSARSVSAEKRKAQIKKTRASGGKGAKPTPAAARSNNVVKESSSPSRSTPGANGQSQQAAPKEAKVHIGSTIKTKDKYLPYDPKNVQELKERRWVVVIDKNTNEELAVVRLTDEKQRNTTELPTYKKGNKRKTYFKHFVEIEDNEGNAIRIDGKKFIKNAEKYNVSKEELNIIQSVVRAHCKQSQSNKDNLKKLKDKK